MANGYRVSSHDFGTIHLLPSLSINNVIYVLRFPFNLLCISCPSLSKLSNLSCESCHLGKQSRKSFSSSVSQRASSPFALVHSDIWRPSRVKSNLGFQYFVTFIYDFSRCT